MLLIRGHELTGSALSIRNSLQSALPQRTMGSLNVINGASERISSHSNASKWRDTGNHDHAARAALGGLAHGCTHEDVADACGQERRFQQSIETLQYYLFALRKESLQVSMKASPATSYAESTVRSKVHKLCSDIHALVSSSWRY